MDYKTLAEVANNSEQIYTAITAGIALGGLAVGYAIGALRLSGRRVRVAEAESAARVEEAKARSAEAEYRREELKDADGAHKRKLAVLTLEREHKIADEDRQRQLAREDDGREEQRKQRVYEAKEARERVKHERRLAVAKELAGLAPELRAYLDRLTAAEQSDTALEAEEAAFKRKLYRQILDKIDEDETDGVAGRIKNEETVISDDDEEAINHLAELLYSPGSKRKHLIEQMPPQLKGLIKIVLEPDKEEEEE